ncbi:MAG: nucleotidyltransferase family protein [Syntrophobacteria bacterium]
MHLKANEKEALAELGSILKERFSVVDLWLFGSKARGVASGESDLDVMIVLEKSTPEIQSTIDDLVFELNLAHDCLISSVVFSKEELEAGPLSESPLYRTVINEGVRV